MEKLASDGGKEGAEVVGMNDEARGDPMELPTGRIDRGPKWKRLPQNRFYHNDIDPTTSLASRKPDHLVSDTETQLSLSDDDGNNAYEEEFSMLKVKNRSRLGTPDKRKKPFPDKFMTVLPKRGLRLKPEVLQQLRTDGLIGHTSSGKHYGPPPILKPLTPILSPSAFSAKHYGPPPILKPLTPIPSPPYPTGKHPLQAIRCRPIYGDPLMFPACYCYGGKLPSMPRVALKNDDSLGQGRRSGDPFAGTKTSKTHNRPQAVDDRKERSHKKGNGSGDESGRQTFRIYTPLPKIYSDGGDCMDLESVRRELQACYGGAGLHHDVHIKPKHKESTTGTYRRLTNKSLSDDEL